ncbi:hypothetical protein, partial [Alistipes ihumii]|uniref:hypothetical protein n=1 Tax=Alistipes ihumii TaxID=1470347 RepID=UPI00266BBE67
MEFIWYFSFFPSPEKYSRNCTKLSFFPENQTSASRKKPPGNSLRTLRPEACDLKTFPAGSPVPFGPNGTGIKKRRALRECPPGVRSYRRYLLAAFLS